MDRAASPSPNPSSQFPSTMGTETGMRRAMLQWLERIESNPKLDALATRLDGLAAKVSQGRTGEVLRGEPLGHPLHPALTDLPIGFFTSANVLDLIGGRSGRTAARRLIALGLLSVPATAAAGLADYSGMTDPKTRRVAAVHAVGNSVAALLYLSSWRARGRSRYIRGKLLALAGAGVATGAGYLGGRLAFGENGGGGGDDGSADDPTNPHLIGRIEAAEVLTVPVDRIDVMVADGILLPVPDSNGELLFDRAMVDAVRHQGA